MRKPVGKAWDWLRVVPPCETTAGRTFKRMSRCLSYPYRTSLLVITSHSPNHQNQRLPKPWRAAYPWPFVQGLFAYLKEKEERQGPLLFCHEWCRRGDLNPHGDRPPPPQDGVSTNSTTSASNCYQEKSGQCCSDAVLRCCSSNGGTAGRLHSNTSLLFRLGKRRLGQQGSLLGFYRNRLGRSLFDYRGNLS